MQKKQMKFPCFFASISSVKTNSTLDEYFSFLELIGYPYILLSAYDIFHYNLKNPDTKTHIAKPETRRNHIMLDSGGYEAYWLKDDDWTPDMYNDVLSKNYPDFFLSFDHNSADDNDTFNQTHWKRKNILQIIHNSKEDYWKSISLEKIEDPNKFIALPERELGHGIIERVLTLNGIFQNISEMGLSYRIHLLGTGNPLSLLLYSACGVSSFDGLEWCKTVVNPESRLLYHFTQRNLFFCDCEACQSNDSITYETQTLAHNILFYISWMKEIQHHLKNGQISVLLEECFEHKLLDKMDLV